ncbi:MAG: hypothetical protein NC420_05385 [Eubacterium sp.]|nr:hypothetical protein [Eubacterium sp.]
MNKKEALSILAQDLEGYMEQGFRFHPLFMKEFKKLLSNASGNEEEIFALLVKQLNYVKLLKKQVFTADGNEIIKYLNKEYYSLHLLAKNFNLRLLMTFNESNVPIFLAAFYERSGKRNSDYTQWKKVLAARYDEM